MKTLSRDTTSFTRTDEKSILCRNYPEVLLERLVVQLFFLFIVRHFTTEPKNREVSRRISFIVVLATGASQIANNAAQPRQQTDGNLFRSDALSRGEPA